MLTYRHAVCLKFGNKFFTSLTILGLQAKANICSTIKENPPLYCRMFSRFCHRSDEFSQRNTTCKRNHQVSNRVINVSK